MKTWRCRRPARAVRHAVLDLVCDQVEPARHRRELDLSCIHIRSGSASPPCFRVPPAPFKVGVEEELLLVDPQTHALAHTSSQVLAALGETTADIKHDLFEAQIEIASPPSADVAEAIAALRQHRSEVREAGGCLLGAGVHPAAEFGDVEVVDAERYTRELRNLRGIVQRTPDSRSTSTSGCRTRRPRSPSTTPCASASPAGGPVAATPPFWHGLDSGFSCRGWCCAAPIPRTEVPPAFRTGTTTRRPSRYVLKAGEVPDYTFLWWDVRPHPKLGTVELRVMDAQSSLRDVEALAALVHGLACHAGERGAPEASAARRSPNRRSGRRAMGWRRGCGRAGGCDRWPSWRPRPSSWRGRTPGMRPRT